MIVIMVVMRMASLMRQYLFVGFLTREHLLKLFVHVMVMVVFMITCVCHNVFPFSKK